MHLEDAIKDYLVLNDKSGDCHACLVWSELSKNEYDNEKMS